MGWSCDWSIDWGSVPDWVAGLGSIGALVFIYVGLSREIRRQRDEAQANLAAQARLVYTGMLDRVGDEVASVTVYNASNGPVFTVVLVPMAAGVMGPEPMRPSPAVDTQDRDNKIDIREHVQYFVRAAPGESLAEMTHVDLTFTDQFGNEWLRRLGTGQPEQVTGD